MGEFHVVFGVGPLGQAVGAELVLQGRPVRLVGRHPRAASPVAGAGFIAGDATDPAATRGLCAGATHVYQCTNPPDYHRWPRQFPPLQEGIVAGAASAGAKLVVMENLYPYGPQWGQPLTEDLSLLATGPRGATRKRMTLDLFGYHARGEVRVVAGRASDFFGPGVVQSLLGESVFRAVLAGKPVLVNGDPDQPHSYSYLGDVARALARLTLPVLGLVVPPLRGLEENFHQMYEPFVIDPGQFERAYGNRLRATALEESIPLTLRWYRDHPATPTPG